jgi:hypothetical protein
VSKKASPLRREIRILRKHRHRILRYADGSIYDYTAMRWLRRDLAGMKEKLGWT